MSITIYGDPQPKGSKSAFVVRRKGALADAKGAKAYRAIVTDVSHGSALDRYTIWKRAVMAAALEVMIEGGAQMPLDGPLAIVATFHMRRPKNETKSQRLRVWHSVKPDVDKLLRALLDPLSRVVIRDDARIAHALLEKRYVPYSDDALPRACITISNVLDSR